MGYKDDPEVQALFNTFRIAKRKHVSGRVRQTLGALAETLRTGTPGAETMSKREPQYGTMSRTQKIQASTPIIKNLEDRERELTIAGADFEEQMRLEKGRVDRAILTAVRAIAERDGQLAGQNASQQLNYLKQATDKHEEDRKRVLNGSKQTQEDIDAAMDPRKTSAWRTVQGVARAGAEGLAKEKGLRAGTLEFEAFVAKTAARAEKGLAEELQAGRDLTAPNGAPIPGSAEEYQRGAIKAAEGVIDGLPPSAYGERAAAARRMASQLGIDPEAAMAMMAPEVAASVAADEQAGAGLLAAGQEAAESAKAAAEEKLSRYGTSHREVNDAIQAATTPASQYTDIDAARAVVEGSDGPPGDLGVRTSEQATELEATERQGGAPTRREWNMDDPEDRAYRRMGLPFPPGDDASAKLEAMLTQIERMPELPPVQEAKKALLGSAQYQEYKAKKGYTTDDVAFKEFTRDLRHGRKKALQEDARVARDNRKVGESARGPLSVYAGERHASDNVKVRNSAQERLGKIPLVQGSRGSVEE